MIHIFTTDLQPAIGFWDKSLGKPYHRVRLKPFRRFYCHSCGRVRLAKNMGVKVYFDKIDFFCLKGGCKNDK